MVGRYKTGTRLKMEVVLTVLSYDDDEDAYMVRDDDGALMQVQALALHGDDWVEQPDA